MDHLNLLVKLTLVLYICRQTCFVLRSNSISTVLLKYEASSGFKGGSLFMKSHSLFIWTVSSERRSLSIGSWLVRTSQAMLAWRYCWASSTFFGGSSVINVISSASISGFVRLKQTDNSITKTCIYSTKSLL